MAEVPDPDRGPASPNTVFLDITLSLLHGPRLPVGILRVEHDIARRFLARPDIDLRFVTFDRTARAYRAATGPETLMMADILSGAFARARPAATMAGIDLLEDAHVLRAARLGLASAAALFGGIRRIAMRVSRSPHRAVAARAAGFAARWWPQPAPAEHCRPMARLLRPVLRLGFVGAVRLAHLLLIALALLEGWLARGATLLRHRRVTAPPADPRSPISQDLPPDAVLIMAGNPWDWLDFDHLDRMVRQRGLRVIAVIYDVIAVDMPWVTPGTPDIYHRFFLEMGHLARTIVTISTYTADRYRAAIAEPNDLDPEISPCLLPAALADGDIGAPMAVPMLEQCRFVMYVSTIESRKNHRLLIEIWERLRQELPPDVLPTLVFVGQWAWGTSHERQMVERNWRLQPHLKVLSGVGDAELAWLYRHALFTVFPSHAEGFGLGAAESLALGTPCLISDCPALMEATDGLMPAIDPLDFAAWHAAISRLLTKPEELAALRTRVGRFRRIPSDAFAEHLARVAEKAAA